VNNNNNNNIRNAVDFSLFRLPEALHCNVLGKPLNESKQIENIGAVPGIQGEAVRCSLLEVVVAAVFSIVGRMHMTELATVLTEASGTWIIVVVAVNKTGKVYEKRDSRVVLGQVEEAEAVVDSHPESNQDGHCHISLDPFPERSEQAPDQVPDQSKVGFVKEGQKRDRSRPIMTPEAILERDEAGAPGSRLRGRTVANRPTCPTGCQSSKPRGQLQVETSHVPGGALDGPSPP
jgi:hypothetical protein